MTLEKFLIRHTAAMLVCFNLTHFTVMFKRRPKLDCSAEIDIDLEYLEAVIFYGKKLEATYRRDKKEVLKVLAHELSHIILENLAETPGSPKKKHRIACEQATEHVSRLLYRLYTIERKKC